MIALPFAISITYPIPSSCNLLEQDLLLLCLCNHRLTQIMASLLTFIIPLSLTGGDKGEGEDANRTCSPYLTSPVTKSLRL